LLFAGTSKGGKGFLKEALSKLSPTSKNRRVQKACPHCKTLISIRATKCPNEVCGKKVESKAAGKRAAVLERKLAQKTSFKKAWDEIILAAKRLHNCKWGGARLAVLAMKGGEKVDSVMTFGLGGGLRYVGSKKVQASFAQAVKEEIAEERKVRKAAAEAAKMSDKAAPKEQHLPSEGPAADMPAAGGINRPSGTVPNVPTGDGNGLVLSQVLASVVDAMDLFEEQKQLIRAGLVKHEFDLTTAKATNASEFAILFPTVPYARLKALEMSLKEV
jgi:hypothetical protein